MNKQRKIIIQKEVNMIIASIMTGTSVDGVDVFVMDYKTKKKLGFYSFDFDKEEAKYIKSFLWPNNKNMLEISTFNFNFSNIVAKYFNMIDKEVLKDVEYVAFHGQTVFHDPNKEFSKDVSTLQLGNGAVLANSINKNVICDFRSSDVSVNGQGAPLVPYGDKYLFWKNNDIMILNVGGISNVTVIQKDGTIKGFDLGVGNALMDSFADKAYNIPYDKNGDIASKGKLNNNFLDYLIKKDDFLRKDFPKSTGKEKYNLSYIEKYIKDNKINNQDVMKTLNEYTSLTINTLSNAFDLSKYEVFIAGGGAYNPVLMESLKQKIKHIESIEKIGYSPQEREAASFGVLAYNFINNIKIGETTGADKRTVAGALYKYIK